MGAGKSRRQAARTTIHRYSLPVAIDVLARFRNRLEIEFNVVRNKEVEASVAIVVDERASSPPIASGVRHGKAGLLGNIGKGAVAVIAIELVLPEIGTENILPPVVVVVAHAD